jgi:predicted nucleotidyltransferase
MKALESFTGGANTERRNGESAARQWVGYAAEVAQDALVGVVLFGSAARGQASEGSDVDLLVVIESTVVLNRSLYQRWDAVCRDERVSPHFVHLPRHALDGGSLWFEVAIDGIALYERGLRVSRHLCRVRQAIADGLIERRKAYGHGYWVKHGEGVAHAQ